MDWENETYQKQLEAEIQREFDQLPQLHAPASLARRVAAAIEQASLLPWYRKPWELWPTPLRIGTLVFLLGCFGGLCFASWQLTRVAGFSAALQEVGEVFSGATALWNAVTALVTTLLLVIKHLGTGFLIGIGLIIAAGYAACLSVGTLFYRMAFAQRT